VRFVVEKEALGQIFSEYFGFPCQFSFHRLLHIHHHLSSGLGTTVQLVADVPSGLSLAPRQEAKKKYVTFAVKTRTEYIHEDFCILSCHAVYFGAPSSEQVNPENRFL
jgi:hypothetical protein